MSENTKIINLRQLHEAACNNIVEVELGIIKNAKDWLSLETNTASRLTLALTPKNKVFFMIMNFCKGKGDYPMRDIEFTIEEGQTVINKLFESTNFIDQAGDRYFQLEDVKKIFERDLALSPEVLA
jgi:hypothetical protein